MNTAQDFVNLFVESSGELLYFIVIFVIYQAAFLMSFGQRTRSKNELAASRYMIALGAATLAWLVLMAGGLYTIIVDDSTDVLAPLERAVNTTIIIWIGWAFLTADDKQGDREPLTVAFALTVMVGLGLMGSFTIWDATSNFEDSALANIWALLPIIAATIGVVFLVTQFSSAADIPLKFLFALLISAGHVYALFEANGIGAIRWAMFTSSALILVIIYRLVIDRMRIAINEVATYAETISKPLAPVVATPANEVSLLGRKLTAQTAGTASLGGRNEALELLKALGIMLDEPDTDAIPKQIVFSACQAFKADVVAVMAIDGDKWADIMAAYDQVNDHEISGMSMNLREQPTLMEAIDAKRQKYVTVDDSADELRDLYTRLDVEPIGPAYFQPLTREGLIVGVLAIGFPYTHRVLSSEDLRLLETIAPVAARLLVISRSAVKKRVDAETNAIQAILESEIGELAEKNNADRDALRANLEQAQIQIRELNNFVNQLENELERERSRVQELVSDGEDAMSITQRINVLSLEREQLREERINLFNALQEAKASLMSVTAEDDIEVYKTMIDDLQKEFEDLQAQKESLEHQLAQIREANDTGDAALRLREMIDSLTEEKANIAADRDSLSNQLTQIRSQMQSLGIEDGIVGLARQIAQLSEDRMYYKAQAERAIKDREVLLEERRKLEEAIADETLRSTRIQNLEDEVSRLMKDREALARGRDSLKIEREAFMAEREGWRTERARMIAHNDALKMELDDTLELLQQANEERQELQAQLNQITTDQNMMRANLARTSNERDALLARIEGDRDRLREVGAEGVGTLTNMIEDLNKERANLEKKLMDSQQQLQNLKWEQIKLQEARSEISEATTVDVGTIRSLSQELITPISAISHYVEVLMGESVGALSALQDEFLTRVKSNIDRLNALISDLIQASSLLEAGTAELSKYSLNMVDIIDDAITNSRHKFSEKGIVLDLDIVDTELMIHGDRSALSQVMTHLIDNAYLVSPTDGNVRVMAAFQANGNDSSKDVLVSISDQGGGIPEDAYDVVFNPVNRANNNIIDGLGHSGIELSLVKGLIEAHNGQLWLETESGVGTTFKFTIPAESEAAKGG
jgi:signal transduction histidine kinase